MPALDHPAAILAVTGKARPESADLPWAAEETAWLVRSFRGARARSISGSEDSPAWTPELDRCDVLHLAAHVTVDDAHPWRSGLAGMRAQDIAKRKLSARLAVLAGCESAGGRVVSGEGVIGLTSALEVAGLPTVVATLWPVSDRVTWTLTRSFYSALAGGCTAGDALRLAQNMVRADPRTSHPFYWAGFVLIGEAETRIPLQQAGPDPALLASIAAFVAALAVAGSIGHRNRRRRCDSSAGGDS